eukprot:5525628-Lingulodinium_polyedra.AAC.1
MFDRYAQARGGLPHVDHEPTSEQLSAVHHLLGSGAPLYVCFSIFGPHGRRLQRRLVHTAYSFTFQT